MLWSRSENRAHPSARGPRLVLRRGGPREPAVSAREKQSGTGRRVACALPAECAEISCRAGGRKRGGRRTVRNPGFAAVARLMENRCLSPGPEHRMEVTDPSASWKRGHRVEALRDPAGRRLSLGSWVFAASA